MEYVHPKKYKGLKMDTPNIQNVVKTRVEKYCMKCDLFMGKEHDFSECILHDVWEKGKVIEKKSCPFNHMAVALFEPKIKCKSE